MRSSTSVDALYSQWSYVMHKSIVIVPTWLSIYWVTLANWMANEVSWKLFPLFVKTVLASTSGSSRNSNRDMLWAVSVFCSSPTRVRNKRMLPTSLKTPSILSAWIRAWNNTSIKNSGRCHHYLLIVHNSYFNFDFGTAKCQPNVHNFTIKQISTIWGLLYEVR